MHEKNKKLSTKQNFIKQAYATDTSSNREHKVLIKTQDSNTLPFFSNKNCALQWAILIV